ncbi:hypothetical protein HYS91_02720 [Candidatus Daviesbacteria bacterium]|nr:hypothetical protein [Candidatus Daviesbacteria bacterium]
MLHVNLSWEFLQNGFFQNRKALIGIFVGLIIAIPTLTFLLKTRVGFQSQASTDQPYNQTVTDKTKDKKGLSLEDLTKDTKGATDSAEITPKVGFGPTLNFKIQLQGRPKSDQSTSLFIGLAEGDIKVNPPYLLTFTIDIDKTGIFEGLSLAGLTVGSKYSAYLKGTAQIASSSTFTMGGATNILNSNNPILLTTGDLNEDNTIDSLDYNIAKAAMGKTSKSPNWNGVIDFNLDRVINNLDLSIIVKNMSKTGAGDLYISKVSSQSGILTPSTGSTPNELPTPRGGYWLWVPE